MKKLNKMDVYLIGVAVAAAVFTIKMVNVFQQTGAEPSTLIVGVFAFLGGECGYLALIKTTNEKKQERKWQLEDREHEDKKSTKEE